MRRALVILMAWMAAAAVGLVFKNDYFVSVATTMAFLALWAQSWNLLCGLTGNISLGHSRYSLRSPPMSPSSCFSKRALAAAGRPCWDSWSVLLAGIVGAATLRLRAALTSRWRRYPRRLWFCR